MSARVPSYLASLFLFSWAVVALNGAVVEFSSDKAPLVDAVGTCMYSPTETEKKFYEKLSEADQSTFQSKPGELKKRYHFKLSSHRDRFVSWWGIVHEIRRNPSGSGGVLLIENKYADGLTDCHIETVSINGAGDFEIELSDLPEDLIPLVLVRVYGVVSGEREKHPVIKADYMRVWHWWQFNFDGSGEDHSNPQWKKRRKLPQDERVYHMSVSRDYYEARLGPTREEWDQLAAFYRGQTEMEFETRSSYAEEHTDLYKPSEWEQRYFDRLDKNERVTVQTEEAGATAPHFELRGHAHKYVSWFGIVREITPVLGKRGGTLLLENTYYKGIGDKQLQTVSLHGAGDFKADTTNLSDELMPLMLVRIYGTVTHEDGSVPVVEAAYIRAWHLGQFNFDDYGIDHTNPEWKKNVELKGPVHQTKVNADYYIQRLGPTKEQTQKIKEFFQFEEQREEALRKLEQAPVEEVKVKP